MVDIFISKEEMMEAPPIFRDSYINGYKQGLQEGKQELQKNKVHMTLNALDFRFPLIPYDYSAIRKSFYTLTDVELEQALLKTISSSNLEDFKNWLYNCKIASNEV